MAAVEALSSAARVLLDQSGSAAEITQNHQQQKETIHWTKRGFYLDSYSLLLDALDHSKDEIRSQYDTYVYRIDTLILVLALIWPFALNTIQFSDPFVPGLVHEKNCPECLEAKYRWVVYVWVSLLGTILILPFWGILMLIRVKFKLDSWLEYSLAGIHRERREVMQDDPNRPDNQQIVAHLVDTVLRYQDYLGRIWSSECGWLVHAATMLLWMSTVAALWLVSLSMIIFFWDKGGPFKKNLPYFAAMITFGCITPAIYVLKQKFCTPAPRRPSGDADVMAEEEFPLTSARVQHSKPTLRRNRSWS